MFGIDTAPEGVSKGNRTRLLNEINQSKKSSFAGNQAAVNSIRDVVAPLKKQPHSNIGGYAESGNTGPQQLQGPSAVGAGQYDLSALSAPAVEQPEDPVKRYNRDAAIDRVISSPDMMDAVTKLKLRNYFQGRSDEGLGTEALGIVKQMHGIS